MRGVAELAGDVLCVGVPDRVLSEQTARELAALQPGAVILFDRNVSSLDATRELVRAMRDAIGSGVPPLVCVDQEGGRVARLTFAEPGVPAMMALGATGDPDLAERVGARLARDCAAIGANVDFAPVLDLALVPASTVVGTRSFGDDAERVATLGAAVVRGLEREGIVSVPKHFPGHGATAVDSHVALPTIETSAADLRARDFVPFVRAFAAGARAVMSVHAIVTALDPDRPATLSPLVLTTCLREELGFSGVCFTDCLEMDAISKGVGTARGAVLALAAGADCCIVSHELALARDARDAIVAAVDDGTLPLSRLREASDRVRALRVQCAAREPPPADDVSASPTGADDVPSLVAARAIARVSGELVLDPQLPVTVVSFEGEAGDGVASQARARPSLSLALRRRRLRSERFAVPLAPDDDMANVLFDVLDAQGDRSLVIVARRAHVYPSQRALIAALLARAPHAVAVSALEPFDVTYLAGARGIACTFDDGEATTDALADVLVGRRTATGTLPVGGAAERA
ncbi:MAG: glycoside hydrolase family 3 protein [Vulcanimicrobiaceae bacterium]